MLPRRKPATSAAAITLLLASSSCAAAQISSINDPLTGEPIALLKGSDFRRRRKLEATCPEAIDEDGESHYHPHFHFHPARGTIYMDQRVLCTNANGYPGVWKMIPLAENIPQYISATADECCEKFYGRHGVPSDQCMIEDVCAEKPPTQVPTYHPTPKPKQWVDNDCHPWHISFAGRRSCINDDFDIPNGLKNAILKNGCQPLNGQYFFESADDCCEKYHYKGMSEKDCVVIDINNPTTTKATAAAAADNSCHSWHPSITSPNTCTNDGNVPNGWKNGCPNYNGKLFFETDDDCCDEYYGHIPKEDCIKIDVSGMNQNSGTITTTTTSPTTTTSSAPSAHPTSDPSVSSQPLSVPTVSPSVSAQPSSGPSASPSVSSKPSDSPSLSPSVSGQPSTKTIEACQDHSFSNYFHPALGDNIICTNAPNYPAAWRMINEESVPKFLFKSAEECCREYYGYFNIPMRACHIEDMCPEGKGMSVASDDLIEPRSDDICMHLWAPVCGEDGTTYSNHCEAKKISVQVAYLGECLEEVSAEICSPGGRCSAEGSTCAVGTKTCCGVTYDSLKCDCMDGRWSCIATDACMMPCSPTAQPVAVTTTTSTTAAEEIVTHSAGFCGKWHMSREYPNTCTNSDAGTHTPTGDCIGWYQTGEECCSGLGTEDCNKIDVSATSTQATLNTSGDMDRNSDSLENNVCDGQTSKKLCRKERKQGCIWDKSLKTCRHKDDEDSNDSSGSATGETCSTFYKKKRMCEGEGCVWTKSKSRKDKCIPP